MADANRSGPREAHIGSGTAARRGLEIEVQMVAVGSIVVRRQERVHAPALDGGTDQTGPDLLASTPNARIRTILQPASWIGLGHGRGLPVAAKSPDVDG